MNSNIKFKSIFWDVISNPTKRLKRGAVSIVPASFCPQQTLKAGPDKLSWSYSTNIRAAKLINLALCIESIKLCIGVDDPIENILSYGGTHDFTHS